MSTLTAELGPGPLRTASGSVFEVTPGEWAALCGFARQVADAGPGAAQRLAPFVPVFPDLQGMAQQWDSQTFPGIVSLARSMARYGSETVQRSYAQLAELLPDLETGRPQDSTRRAFAAVMAGLEAEAGANLGAATTADGAVTAFCSAVQTAESQVEPYVTLRAAPGARPAAAPADIMRQVAEIGRLIGRLAGAVLRLQHPPLRELQRIRGGWSAIRSDVDFVGRSINAEIAAADPFIADLSIDVARSAWQQVAVEATAFVAGVSAAR